MNQEKLHQIEQIVGHKFSNPDLLKEAFAHSSSVDDRLLSNERMEFFGDAVLSMIICKVLFEKFPEYLEGDLTKIKSMLVSRRTCAKVARGLELEKFLDVGKGMTSSRSLTGSLAAGLLEAVIAAIYLDGGFRAAQSFILKIFASLIEQADAKQTQGNFKSLLQQHVQQRFDATPVYELLDEKGPDHDKCFEVTAVVDGRRFKSAWGTNKKDAAQKAAYNALVELGVIKRTEDDEGQAD
jgi:ribonuclease III